LKVFYNEDKKVILILNRRTDLVQNQYTVLIFSMTEVRRTSVTETTTLSFVLVPREEESSFSGAAAGINPCWYYKEQPTERPGLEPRILRSEKRARVVRLDYVT